MPLLKINIAVLLFGLAGILAKFIDLPALAITFGRVFFSSLTLLLYSRAVHLLVTLKRKDLMMMAFGGALLACHWWLFLESIKMSNVAIGTITFAAFPLFLTFLEPLVFHEKISRENVAVSLVILLGVLVMVEDFNLANGTTIAILIGLVSAFLYSVLSLVNRTLVAAYSGVTISLYQHAVAMMVLFPYVVRLDFNLDLKSLGLVAILGVVSTAIGHALYVNSLKQVAVQVAGIISSLESVYGIVLAVILLGEIPTLRQVAGGAVIIMAVVISRMKKDGRERNTGKIIE